MIQDFILITRLPRAGAFFLGLVLSKHAALEISHWLSI